jgi:hypothetical protein
MADIEAYKINGGGDPAKRHERDFYPTPEEVTRAIMEILHPDKNIKIWEPACGEGHIVKALNNMGYMNVIGTDILTGTDYLTADKVGGVSLIITNPPFNQAEAFIRRSWEHNVPFALLLKSQFWHAARRYELFNECRPSIIYPLTWRPDFTGQGSSLMDCIWTVWLRDEEKYTKYEPIKKRQ